jgi:hypothetical protein
VPEECFPEPAIGVYRIPAATQERPSVWLEEVDLREPFLVKPEPETLITT